MPAAARATGSPEEHIVRLMYVHVQFLVTSKCAIKVCEPTPTCCWHSVNVAANLCCEATLYLLLQQTCTDANQYGLGNVFCNRLQTPA